MRPAFIEVLLARYHQLRDVEAKNQLFTALNLYLGYLPQLGDYVSDAQVFIHGLRSVMVTVAGTVLSNSHICGTELMSRFVQVSGC